MELREKTRGKFKGVLRNSLQGLLLLRMWRVLFFIGHWRSALRTNFRKARARLVEEATKIKNLSVKEVNRRLKVIRRIWRLVLPKIEEETGLAPETHLQVLRWEGTSPIFASFISLRQRPLWWIAGTKRFQSLRLLIIRLASAGSFLGLQCAACGKVVLGHLAELYPDWFFRHVEDLWHWFGYGLCQSFSLFSGSSF